ncbi:MAG: hypothetical protein HRT44_11960, partial [Bdellovibrionales bacterium]|nr:hypothetical protein [Bdellovibrionales bacterium]NQZ19953.1 hypothetical protein [Bdellovibrionales bacterium]
MRLLFVLILIFSQFVSAQEEDVDHVALASILVRDGLYARAEITLEKAKPEKDQRALVESLWGMIKLQKKKYKEAIAQFEKSISLGIKSKEVYIY